ncbi:MAG: FAD-binding oxidoreductase [Alphaproteobacteria bacterium]|nr:FAD-binding oxidoreductase [Alphaproteobacteria bacterium]
MTAVFDVAIVGGSVMGSAAAYFLTADPGFHGRVLVLERDPSYHEASAARSWGGFRQQFSTPENIRMSAFGVGFFREAAGRLAVDGEAPDLGIRAPGYLFLASPEGLPILSQNMATQSRLGAAIELLDPPSLARRFPWLNVDGLAAGALGLKDEGWLDPAALIQAFRRKARAQGALYRQAEAVALERAGDRVAGVRLADGERIAAGLVVNAAGWRAGRLAATAGIALPVGPRKRMTYVFDCKQDLSAAPMTIDPTGVVFRPEGRQYIGLVSPPETEDPERHDLDEEYELFETTVWPTLAARVPAFETIKLTRAWAGLYDYNAFDHNAIIGRHPEVGNLIFCNGFSGHGVQQSPAAGRAVAELIQHGRFQTLDLARFGYERIADKRPIVEANIV